jgi:hypothetical protein
VGALEVLVDLVTAGVVVVVVVLVQALRINGKISTKDTTIRIHFLFSLLNNIISCFVFVYP